MIAFEDVGMVKGRRHILQDVNLETTPGEVTVVLGVNGAGKSSLVRLISGEWTPSTGRVCWKGDSLSSLDPRSLAKERAVVNQQADMAFEFPVREVVEMGRYPHGSSDPAGSVEAALEEMELIRLADVPVTRLSGGERRRVWLARALAQLAEARAGGRGLLVLDEPTAHLDLRHQERLLQRIRALASEGLSILVVLHELNHTARIADRVVLMHRGRVEAQGVTRDVMCPDRLSRVFGLPLCRVSTSGKGSRWQPAGVTDSHTYFDTEYEHESWASGPHSSAPGTGAVHCL